MATSVDWPELSAQKNMNSEKVCFNRYAWDHFEWESDEFEKFEQAPRRGMGSREILPL